MGSGSSTPGKSSIPTEAEAAVFIQAVVRMQQSKKRANKLFAQQKVRLKQENAAKRKENNIRVSLQHEASLVIQCAFRCSIARQKLQALKLSKCRVVENAEHARARLQVAVMCQRVIRHRQHRKFADIVLQAIKMKAKFEADGDDFLIAADNGNIEECRKLLPYDYDDEMEGNNIFREEGFQNGHASINWVDRDGLTALHFACLNGDVKMVEFLLSNDDCDVSPVSRWGTTPLGILKELIANVQHPKAWPHYKSNEAKLLKMNYLQCEAMLLNKRGSLSSEEANMQLFRACEEGSVDKCRICIDEYGASPNVFGLTKRLINTYHREIGRSDGLPNHDVLKHLLSKNKSYEKINRRMGNHSPLHRAVFHNQLKVVEYLLSLVDNPNQTNDELLCETPLHIASAKGYSSIVSALLKHPSINPNAKDSNGDTPLHFAAKNGHPDVIKSLLFISSHRLNSHSVSCQESLEQPNLPQVTSSQDSKHESQVSCDEEFDNIAVKSPDKKTKVVKRIRRNSCLSSPIGFGATTPLGLSRQGRVEACELPPCMNEKAHTWKQQQESIKKSNEMSARYEACCTLLEESGATVSLEEADIGLLEAARDGDIDKCRVCFEEEGARIDCTRPMVGASAHFKKLHEDGRTPLHLAAMGGQQKHINVIDYLLYKGANKELMDIHGETPRMISERLGNQAAARRFRDPYQRKLTPYENFEQEMLFSRGGARAFGFDELSDSSSLNGTTPITNSANLSEEKAVQRAKVLSQANILFASKMGYADRVQTLLEESIGLFKDEIDDLDKLDTAQIQDIDSSDSSDDDDDFIGIGGGRVRVASNKGNPIGLSMGERQAAMTLKTSFNLDNIKLKPGETEDLFSELVKTKSPNFGETPLHFASYKSHIEVMKLLIQYGADVDACDNTNWTPLHYVALVGSTEALEVLLGSGADASLLNIEGENAETIAKKADRDIYFMTLFRKKRPKKVRGGMPPT